MKEAAKQGQIGGLRMLNRMDAEYATPLAGVTYRAHIRYRLAGPHPQVGSCQRGHGTGPLFRAGILALQDGEDVNDVAQSSVSGRYTPHGRPQRALDRMSFRPV